MFSYRGWICNRVRLNVELDGSTAYLRIRWDYASANAAEFAPRDAHPPSGLGLLSFQVYRLHREVPVGREDFETLLLFAFVGFLVGVKLFL
jgi:hypothetical protein